MFVGWRGGSTDRVSGTPQLPKSRLTQESSSTNNPSESLALSNPSDFNISSAAPSFKSSAVEKPSMGLNMSRAMRQLGLSLCFAASLGGFFSNAAAAVTAIQMEPAVAAVQIEKLDEKAEGQILEQAQSCGKLIRLTKGEAGKGAHVSIHGLGSNPADMAPITNPHIDAGKATATFAYNDMHCSSVETSAVLASELKAFIADNAGQDITIETHSLGGRMAVRALDQLNQAGELGQQQVQLNMIAPPLAGFGALNLMMPLPSSVAKLIPGGAPTQDMASFSAAQSHLNQVKLPTTVQTKIFYGSEDKLIDYTTSGAEQIANNLNADVYYFAGQGHYDMISTVANKEANNPSKAPLPYMASVRQASSGEIGY
jgi:hypothetical protein